MATDETGSAAADGYTVRSRKPLERSDFPRDSRYGENHASDGLMNEDEARFKTLYGDD